MVQFTFVLSQTQIAVVDFNALGVSNNDALALTNRLMIEMHRTNKFKVLEREMLDKIIEEQKFQLSGCNADQCLVKLGEIANVQQIVGGTISKVGEVFTITARLISVESGEVVESALYDYDGKIGALMKMGMANIAAQLASTPTSNDPNIVMQGNGSVTPVYSSHKSTEPDYSQTKYGKILDANAFGLSVEDIDYNIVVIGVEPNSLGEKAGILVGDKIFKLNNEYGVSSSEFNRMISLFLNSKTSFTIYYSRDGNTGVLSIKLNDSSTSELFTN
jgi:TolB-like protein